MTEIDDKLYCIGCGARLQTEDKDKPGYVQESTLKKYIEDDSKELLCKRCFRLRNYNEIMDVDVSDDDFLKLLDSISEKDALVVNVVDVFAACHIFAIQVGDVVDAVGGQQVDVGIGIGYYQSFFLLGIGNVGDVVVVQTCDFR